MVTMTLVRNTMGFAMGYAVTPWLNHSGLQNTFIAIAFMHLGCSLLYYPFIYFGKAERKRTAERYYKAAAKTVH